MNREEAMEQEFSKTPGGNYFNYVDTAALERLGITQYKPVLGDNAIRIVFPPDRSGFYGLEIFKHSKIGANQKTFLCRKRMFEESCPICDLADTLRKDDPQDARAKELYTSRRYLFLVVDVSSEEGMRKGVRWFDCPVGIYNEIKSRSKSKRRGQAAEGAHVKKYIDVSHPVEGRDIEFEQTKVKGKYDYEGVTLVQSEPIPEDWYNDLPEFKDVLKNSTVEEIQEALSTETEPEDEVVDNEKTSKTTNEEVQDEVVEEDTPQKEVVREAPNETSVRTASTRNPSSTVKQTKEENTNSVRARVQERLNQKRQAHTVDNDDIPR